MGSPIGPQKNVCISKAAQNYCLPNGKNKLSSIYTDHLSSRCLNPLLPATEAVQESYYSLKGGGVCRECEKGVRQGGGVRPTWEKIILTLNISYFY